MVQKAGSSPQAPQGLLCRMLSYVMVRAQAATQSTTVLPDPSGFHHYPLRCAQGEGGFSSKMQGSPCSFQLCRKHWKKQPTIRCGDKKQGCKRAPRIREEQPNDLALSGWADSCFFQALPPHWAPSSTWHLPQEQCLQKMKWTSANWCQREGNDLSAPSLGPVACCLSAAHTSWVVTTVPCGWLTSNPPQMFIHLEAFSHPRSWQLAHFSSRAKELSFSWTSALWSPSDQLELAPLWFVHYHTG